MKRLVVARFLMTTVLLSLLATSNQASAQPNVVGRWEFIGSQTTPFEWRLNTTRFSWDEISPYVNETWAYQDWKIVYGIHSALVRATDDISYVIMWGLGKTSENRAIQYTPWLQWDAAERLELTGEPGAWGRARYVEDPARTTVEYSGNLFCSSHVFLPDGRLFVGGWQWENTDQAHTKMGSRFAFAFDPTTLSDGIYGSWSGPIDMSDNAGPSVDDYDRWYPSSLALPDGRIIVVGGLTNSEDPYTRNRTYQVFDPSDNSVSDNYTFPTDAAFDFVADEYPRLFLVATPDGANEPEAKVISIGPRQWYPYGVPVDDSPHVFELDPMQPENNWTRAPYSGTGAWSHVGEIPAQRTAGTYVLLPNNTLNPANAGQQVLNRILAFAGKDYNPGGNPDQYTLKSAEIIDYVNKTRTEISGVPTATQARYHASGVLLPNGKVFFLGGAKTVNAYYNGTDPALDTVMYTPSSGVWTAMADMPGSGSGATGRRMYHSSALLLPDGSVFTVGTAAQSNQNPIPTLFTPPDLLDSNGDYVRPILGEVPTTDWHYGIVPNSTVPLTVELPAGRSISSIALMRPGAATHSCDMEQRCIRLKFTGADLVDNLGRYHPTVTPPWYACCATPGWYLLFVVDDAGSYSEGKWVHIE